MKTYQIYLVLLGYLLEQDGDTEEIRTLLLELYKRAEERKEKITDLEKEVTRLQLKVVELTNGIKLESEEKIAYGNGELPHGGWIPVTERLPEEQVPCLCCDYDGYMAICYIQNWSCQHLDGTIYNGKDWSSDDDKIDDIVAWMPLPEPYKAEENEVEE